MGQPDPQDETGEEPVSDAELESESQTLAGLLATLKSESREPAPRGLLYEVQEELRQRSRGRYYGESLRRRFPFEAILQAMLLVGALVVYALAVPEPARRIPVTAQEFVAAGSEVSFAARMLNDYGSFVNQHEGVDANGWRHLVGEIDAARLSALETELSLYPNMRLLEREALDDGRVRVRIAIRSR